MEIVYEIKRRVNLQNCSFISHLALMVVCMLATMDCICYLGAGIVDLHLAAKIF